MELTIIVGESFDKKRAELKLIKQLNWENYYLDEKTHEKWIEEYPHSQLQGGGDPQLRKIEKFPWE
jgi:Immunity protein 27